MLTGGPSQKLKKSSVEGLVLTCLNQFSQYVKIARLAQGEDSNKLLDSSMDFTSGDMEGVEEGNVDLQRVQNSVTKNSLLIHFIPRHVSQKLNYFFLLPMRLFLLPVVVQ